MTHSPLAPQLARLALALGLTACAESGTGGEAIEFELALAPSANAAEFTTSTGWSVRLEEARIALGPVYLWENPPPVASRPGPPRHRLAAVADWLIPRAHAHAGSAHFSGGEVLGEWLEQVGFDALAGQEPLGRVAGTAGTARSFSVWLEEPRAAEAREATRGHHAWIAGTATRGDEVVPFEGGLELPEADSARRVEGIATALPLEAGRTVVVTVHVERWLAEAHFDRLASGPGAVRGEGGRWQIVADSQVATAWYLGARSAAAFSASIE